MTVWGVGYGFRFGVTWPFGISPGASVKHAGWLVWDNCGDSGIVLMLEGGGELGEGVTVPVIMELHFEGMKGASIFSLGGGCVRDLTGWGVGIDVGGHVLGGGNVGVDGTSHGLILITSGVGIAIEAKLSGDLHSTRKYFSPIRLGNCPCNPSWWVALAGITIPGAGAYYLAKAIYNWTQPPPPTRTPGE